MNTTVSLASLGQTELSRANFFEIITLAYRGFLGQRRSMGQGRVGH